MCHALDKVVQLAMATFPKSENFLHKLERLLAQTNQLTGRQGSPNDGFNTALNPFSFPLHFLSKCFGTI